MEIERTELEYREGTSDKMYTAAIMEYDNGHQVVFEYGKRHNLVGRIVKPDQPVSYQRALTIYTEMINKKLKKGYVPMN
jgi:predicted DNA-binding WGR domain protein